MRVNIFKTFALVLFLSLTGAAFGQPYLLMSMTNTTWKYNQTGNNLGSVWRSASYTDTVAGWQSGRGVFAFETDNALVLSQTNTVLSLNNTANDRITTYYFRTHFTLTNDPYRVSVLVTNLIDDGAVFYVNGTEVSRFNIAPAPSQITYLTTATAAIEAAYNTFTIPYELLLQGDNVFEVEVHNAGPTSSDIVFGLAASVLPPSGTSSLIITNQPKDLTATEGALVNLSAGVSGFPILSAQWFFNGTAIPGANRLTYTINYLDITNGGTYSLAISNANGAVVSSPALIGVIADTNGPVILAADGTDSLTNVVVTFSERLLPSTATNVSNYRITNINAGTILTLISATLAPDGSNVNVIASTPRNPTNNYLVVVSNVRDSSPHTNLIAPGSAFPVRMAISLLTETSFFYFYNPVVQFGDEPEPTNIWRSVGFNPFIQDVPRQSAWGKSDLQPGIAYFGNSDLPGPTGIKLAQNDVMTPAYFSIPFSMDANPSPLGSSINLEYLVDDGAIFNLNGTEFLRVGLPSGPITYQTPATAVAAPASWKNIFTNLTFRAGTNTMAVELHADQLFDLNFAFGVRVSAELSSFATGPVIITRQPTNITVFEGQTATFSFNAAGAGSFQWYSNDVLIAGATNPVYSIPSVFANMNSNRFKVVASNTSASTTSSNALLTVLSDTNGPAVVSAYCNSSNTIVVTFSEPITAASAQVPGNYAVTNRTAPSLTVSSAVLTNGTNVILTVSQGGAGQYIVVASNNIQDTSGQHNALGRTNAATVGLQVSIPIVTDWKYNNSGTSLGTAWTGKTYPDTTWSNGLSLIYHEEAALPAPKNTELPLEGSATPGVESLAFYFRKHLPLAVGAASAVTSIRHVIDDGVVAYINDAEFHRFNMASGAVAFNTVANATVGDAVYSGPFAGAVSTITGGDNILAAEVHQAASTSSDFVFGIELNINSPSVPIV
ncbi:MAG: hypothetical protein JWM16_6230, partial [Verrucomicrobiales bacterium]|nr:hypothetical protein [Verrucomicrobiales bacterium]